MTGYKHPHTVRCLFHHVFQHTDRECLCLFVTANGRKGQLIMCRFLYPLMIHSHTPRTLHCPGCVHFSLLLGYRWSYYRSPTAALTVLFCYSTPKIGLLLDFSSCFYLPRPTSLCLSSGTSPSLCNSNHRLCQFTSPGGGLSKPNKYVTISVLLCCAVNCFHRLSESEWFQELLCSWYKVPWASLGCLPGVFTLIQFDFDLKLSFPLLRRMFASSERNTSQPLEAYCKEKSHIHSILMHIYGIQAHIPYTSNANTIKKIK